MSKATPATTANGAGTASTVPAVIPRQPPQRPQSESASLLAAIIKVASTPQTDVAKIRELVQLHQSMQDRDAQQRFDEALVACQTELQPVTADAVNQHTNGHKYASYAALDRAIRPIYAKHGLALTFTTGERSTDTSVEVVAFLIGHGQSRRYALLVPADGKGARGGDVMSRTHATASACSYGMRYLATMIFNLAIDRDDDGNAAGGKPKSAYRARKDGDYPRIERKIRQARTLEELSLTWREERPTIQAWPVHWRELIVNEMENKKAAFMDTMDALQASLVHLEEGGQ
jgi:ERF superfamily